MLEISDRYLWWHLILAWVLLIVGVSAPFFSFFLPIPFGSSVDLPNWFGRSGALATVFALLAETVLVKARLAITPPGFGWVGLNEQRENFIPKFNFVGWIIFAATIVGTLIWAYGDLLINYIRTMEQW